MKLKTPHNVLSSISESDIQTLTDGMLSGEIALADGRKLTDLGLSEADVRRLAGEFLRFSVDRSLLTVLIPSLISMKWLTMKEACLHARKSPNTLLSMARQGKIYGMKAGGEWIFERESIDNFYYTRKHRMQIYAEGLRKRSP